MVTDWVGVLSNTARCRGACAKAEQPSPADLCRRDRPRRHRHAADNRHEGPMTRFAAFARRSHRRGNGGRIRVDQATVIETRRDRRRSCRRSGCFAATTRKRPRPASAIRCARRCSATIPTSVASSRSGEEEGEDFRRRSHRLSGRNRAGQELRLDRRQCGASGRGRGC